MDDPANSRTRLKSPWLDIVRTLWLGLILLSLGLFVAGLPKMHNMFTELSGSLSGGIPLDSSGIRQGLAELGLSTRLYAAFILSVAILFAVYCTLTAFLIVWRKLDDWLVLLLSLTYITYGTGYLYTVSPSIFELWASPWDFVSRFLFFFCGVVLYIVFFYLFPDGQISPRWARWLVLVILAWGIYITLVFDGNPFLNPGAIPTAIGIAFTVGALASVIITQIYRYLYVSNPVQKQQTKWVVFGFSVAIILTATITLPAIINPSLLQAGARMVFYVLVTVTFGAIFAVIGLLSLTFAILRYRLWDIDHLIRRTLVYGLLTSTLGITYFGSVILLHSVVQTITGRPADSSAIIILSTLAIAALFTPLRRRIQIGIDRRFYRTKYDAEKILQNFAKVARDEIDLKVVVETLIEAVDEALHPEHISLWLRDPEQR